MRLTAVILLAGAAIQSSLVLAQSAPVPVVERTPSAKPAQSPGFQGSAATGGATAPSASSQPSPNYSPAPNYAAPAPAQNAELLMLLEQLQEEVRYLRGQVEEQAHAMEKMRNDQRDRYRDLDRRITQINEQMNNSPAPAAVAPVPLPAPMSSTPRESSGGNVGATPMPALQSSVTPAPRLSDTEAYQRAWGLVRNKSFEEALKAFADFKQWYPDSSLIPNTLYWTAEVYRAKKTPEPQQALASYQELIERFPEHQKTADAYYKLGLTYHDMGERDKAKTVMQKVIELYPGEAPANLAQNYLSKWAN